MKDTYQQIKNIDNEILDLKAQIRKLEEEKQALQIEYYGSTALILEQLPARARNALIKIGIDTDLKLAHFLHGECEGFINPNATIFNKYRYPSAKTIVARLECIGNIGSGTAVEVAKILKQYSEFQDIV